MSPEFPTGTLCFESVMNPDLVILAVVSLFFFAPLLAKGKWFWIVSSVIALFITYEWGQVYLYRADINNKVGPGDMLGEIIGGFFTGVFLLSLLIKFLAFLAHQSSEKREHNKKLQSDN